MEDYSRVRIVVLIVAGYSQPIAKTIYLNKNLRVFQGSKWMWYFKYIQAKYIIQNPKHYTDIRISRIEVNPNENDIADAKRKEISKQKGRITKAQNRLDEYLRLCRAKDPLNIDPPENWENVKMAIEKINKMKFEFQTLTTNQ